MLTPAEQALLDELTDDDGEEIPTALCGKHPVKQGFCGACIDAEQEHSRYKQALQQLTCRHDWVTWSSVCQRCGAKVGVKVADIQRHATPHRKPTP